MIPVEEGDGLDTRPVPRNRPPGTVNSLQGLIKKYNDNISQIYQGILAPNRSTNTYKTPRTSINSTQPFIYIGPNTDNRTPGVFKGDGGAFLSTANAKDDIRLLPFGVSFARDNNRIMKFLQSPTGLQFIARQTTLQAFNPYTRTKVFNPAAILAATVPGVHVPRFIDTQSFSGFSNGARNGVSRFISSTVDNTLNTDTKLIGPTETLKYGDNGYFTTANAQTSVKGNRVEQFLREEFSTLTNPGKARKKSNIKDPLNATPVGKSGTDSDFKLNYNFLRKNEVSSQQVNNDEDIITFRFKAYKGEGDEETTYIPFRAFISSISENVKPEYNEQRYVGRTERFITYAGAKREVSLAFNIVALSQSEIEHAWSRVNYLTGLAFPKGISQSGFMQPQLFRITIGGIYEDQPCYIQSLDYDFLDETTTFDIERGVSQVINVKMSLSLIEKTSKYYNSPFYRITEDVVKKQQYEPQIRQAQQVLSDLDRITRR